jgi:muconolactone delta-isomerase
MQYMVSVSFVPGQQEAIAALMPAEQAHVRKLLEQGVIETIHIAADRSHIWLAMNGESQEDVRQTMSELPLYPYMQLEYTPLLDLRAARTGNAPEAAQEGGAE